MTSNGRLLLGASTNSGFHVLVTVVLDCQSGDRVNDPPLGRGYSGALEALWELFGGYSG